MRGGAELDGGSYTWGASRVGNIVTLSLAFAMFMEVGQSIRGRSTLRHLCWRCSQPECQQHPRHQLLMLARSQLIGLLQFSYFLPSPASPAEQIGSFDHPNHQRISRIPAMAVAESVNGNGPLRTHASHRDVAVMYHLQLKYAQTLLAYSHCTSLEMPTN